MYGLVRLMDTAWRSTGQIAAPVGCFYGARDDIIPPAPSEEAARRLKPTDRTAYYADGYHLLLVDKQREANRLVREFAETDPKRLGFVDVFTPMLGPDGTPKPELYVSDNLHMSKAGYELWTSVVAPLLGPATAAPARTPAP